MTGRVAALLLLALAGCTTATVDLRPDGTTHVEFSRALTDAAVQVTPEGLTYSSSPSAVAQQQAMALVAQLLGLALRGAVVAPPVATPQAYGLPARLRSPEPPLTMKGGLS